MKKYLRLSCSVCQRYTDKIVDQTRFSTDKCTISLNCTGKLFPVEYRSNAAITASSAVGVVDWQPRKLSQPKLQQQQKGIELIDTSTGVNGQVVLAVQLQYEPSDNSTLVLKLDQQADTPKDYRQYVFRSYEPITTVSGVEAGIEKKTLRYAEEDEVDVFVNGVKLTEGDNPENFRRYKSDLSTGVPPNTITFNSLISSAGTNQVDVIVSSATQSTQVELTFFRNKNDESRKDLGAWENVTSVSAHTGSSFKDFYLFYLDLVDNTQLDQNTIMTLSQPAAIGPTEVQLSEIRMLFAKKPFSTLDRYLSLSAKLSDFNSDTGFLKYHQVDGKATLELASSAIKPVFPNMIVKKFTPELPIKIAIPGVSNQIIIDEPIIVGPDL